MKISNVRVYGIGATSVAARYPMLSRVPSEEDFNTTELGNDSGFDWEFDFCEKGEDKDFKRLCHLGQAKAGSGHDCCMKGIVVQFDCHAPRYWWNQLQRYHFIDFVSSQSQMHRISRLSFESNPDLMEESIELAQKVVDKYNEKELTIDQCLANIPQGLEITARLVTNYLQLKNIYLQRRHHRSRHWQEFCDWVETLPYAKDFILPKEVTEC